MFGQEQVRVEVLVLVSDENSLTRSKCCRIRAFESNSFQGLNKLKDLRIEENGLRSLSNFPVLPR